jgi:sugar transferase (PEP-CTERM/EpsH1 system associated)
MRPHIVHVLHSLGVGGTENGVVNLINAQQDDLRHTVVTMTGGGALTARLPASVEVHSLGKRPGLDWATFLRLRRVLHQLAPDVVHSRNWATFDAVLAARLAKVPAIIHGEQGRSIHDPEGKHPRRNRIRRLLSPLVDRFVTVSFDMRRWLVSEVRIPAHKVITIHNGVDSARFIPADIPAGRTAIGLTPDRPVIGTVGRLDPVKDQAGLIRAFVQVRSQFPEAVLVIAGDGPCREELRGLVASLQLGENVRLLGERKDIPNVLGALDVFVLPSIAEGISNTILEAMATGLPVVATRTGGNPELIVDNVTGILVPVRAPEALARAVNTYLRDPRLRHAHGRTARERAIKDFSLERMASQYRDLYLSLTNGRNRVSC